MLSALLDSTSTSSLLESGLSGYSRSGLADLTCTTSSRISIILPVTSSQVPMSSCTSEVTYPRVDCWCFTVSSTSTQCLTKVATTRMMER